MNKFMCMNELYMYETYCPTDIIKSQKLNYARDRKERSTWTQDELDLINMKKNYIGLGKYIPNIENSPDYELFNRPELINIHKK